MEFLKYFSLIFIVSCISCDPATEKETIFRDLTEVWVEDDSIFLPCPDDMSPHGSLCVDTFEASKKDATATSQGEDESIAVSKKGVLPWFVNPITDSDREKFEKACISAGKVLCSDFEWEEACQGADKNRYSFGNDFNRESCNCVDTYCDDYCEENNISEAECNTSENCGYRCGDGFDSITCFHVMPTGSFPDCVSQGGSQDVNGNVWEIVKTQTGYKTKGGAFNCGGASERLACSYDAGWEALYAGFRCCKSRDIR